MQKLDINGAEVLRLKLRLDEIADSVNTLMTNIGVEVNNCVNNLKDESGNNPLVSPVSKLLTNTENIKTNVVRNLNSLSQFMSDQVYEYSYSTEEAEAAIKELISFIAGAVGSSSGVAVASTFEDSNALSNGEANYSDLESKLPNEEQWNIMDTCHDFFKEKGLTEEQIAGILGNACLESGFELEVKNPGSTCKGIFQWRDTRYPSDWSLETQLNHAWEEMQGTPSGGAITSVVDELKGCNTVDEATNVFAIYFEGAGNGNGGIWAGQGRREYASTIYYHYSNAN